MNMPVFLSDSSPWLKVETEVVLGEDPVEGGSGGPILTCTVRETISGLLSDSDLHCHTT